MGACEFHYECGKIKSEGLTFDPAKAIQLSPHPDGKHVLAPQVWDVRMGSSAWFFGAPSIVHRCTDKLTVQGLWAGRISSTSQKLPLFPETVAHTEA